VVSAAPVALAGTNGHLADATIELDGTPGSVGLVVYAPAAEIVEVMGDFTEWRVVALVRSEGDRWRLARSLAPGLRRLNVRVNGGEWGVPIGATLLHDEFGGTVGLLVVP
jgi:hypothetical protein